MSKQIQPVNTGSPKKGEDLINRKRQAGIKVQALTGLAKNALDQQGRRSPHKTAPFKEGSSPRRWGNRRRSQNNKSAVNKSSEDQSKSKRKSKVFHLNAFSSSPEGRDKQAEKVVREIEKVMSPRGRNSSRSSPRSSPGSSPRSKRRSPGRDKVQFESQTVHEVDDFKVIQDISEAWGDKLVQDIFACCFDAQHHYFDIHLLEFLASVDTFKGSPTGKGAQAIFDRHLALEDEPTLNPDYGQKLCLQGLYSLFYWKKNDFLQEVKQIRDTLEHVYSGDRVSGKLFDEIVDQVTDLLNDRYFNEKAPQGCLSNISKDKQHGDLPNSNLYTKALLQVIRVKKERAVKEKNGETVVVLENSGGGKLVKEWHRRIETALKDSRRLSSRNKHLPAEKNKWLHFFADRLGHEWKEGTTDDYIEEKAKQVRDWAWPRYGRGKELIKDIDSQLAEIFTLLLEKEGEKQTAREILALQRHLYAKRRALLTGQITIPDENLLADARRVVKLLLEASCLRLYSKSWKATEQQIGDLDDPEFNQKLLDTKLPGDLLVKKKELSRGCLAALSIFGFPFLNEELKDFLWGASAPKEIELLWDGRLAHYDTVVEEDGSVRTVSTIGYDVHLVPSEAERSKRQLIKAAHFCPSFEMRLSEEGVLESVGVRSLELSPDWTAPIEKREEALEAFQEISLSGKDMAIEDLFQIGKQKPDRYLQEFSPPKQSCSRMLTVDERNFVAARDFDTEWDRLKVAGFKMRLFVNGKDVLKGEDRVTREDLKIRETLLKAIGADLRNNLAEKLGSDWWRLPFKVLLKKMTSVHLPEMLTETLGESWWEDDTSLKPLLKEMINPDLELKLTEMLGASWWKTPFSNLLSEMTRASLEMTDASLQLELAKALGESRWKTLFKAPLICARLLFVDELKFLFPAFYPAHDQRGGRLKFTRPTIGGTDFYIETQGESTTVERLEWKELEWWYGRGGESKIADVCLGLSFKFEEGQNKPKSLSISLKEFSLNRDSSQAMRLTKTVVKELENLSVLNEIYSKIYPPNAGGFLHKNTFEVRRLEASLKIPPFSRKITSEEQEALPPIEVKEARKELLGLSEKFLVKGEPLLKGKNKESKESTEAFDKALTDALGDSKVCDNSVRALSTDFIDRFATEMKEEYCARLFVKRKGIVVEMDSEATSCEIVIKESGWAHVTKKQWYDMHVVDSGQEQEKLLPIVRFCLGLEIALNKDGEPQEITFHVSNVQLKSREEVQQMHDEIDAKQDEIDRKQDEMDLLQDKMNRLQDEMNRLQNQMNGVQNEMDTVRAEKEETEGKVGEIERGQKEILEVFSGLKEVSNILSNTRNSRVRPHFETDSKNLSRGEGTKE